MNGLGHGEICPGRGPHFHAWHNGITSTLHSNLQACPTNIVTLKHHTDKEQRRNKVGARGASPMGSIDYDLEI